MLNAQRTKPTTFVLVELFLVVRHSSGGQASAGGGGARLPGSVAESTGGADCRAFEDKLETDAIGVHDVPAAIEGRCSMDVIDAGHLTCYVHEGGGGPTAGGVSIHLLADASPQGGRDYELLFLNILPRAKLPDLYDDIRALEGLCRMGIEERIRYADQEKELFERIQDAITTHTAPPVLLGGGKSRSTLAIKFRAVLHALFLIGGPFSMLEKLLKGIHTWTSDFGTEAGFSLIEPVALKKIFDYLEAPGGVEEPDMAPLEREDLEEPDFAAPAGVAPAPQQPADEVADVTGSVLAPGLLHIIHNSTLDLAKCMQHFRGVVYKLKKVCKMLSSKEGSDRLLQLCFDTPVGKALSRELAKFHASVYEERWGTVANAVLKILDVRVALCHGWNLQKFLMGVGRFKPLDVTDDDPDHDMRPDVIDEAVNSTFFWSYLQMLRKVALLLMRLMDWAEGCSCHWDLPYDEKLLPASLLQLWSTCPLRGRRCADLASGELWRVVQPLCDESAALLVLELPTSLTSSERSDIMEDFERARAQLIFTFTMKLHHWNEMPWAVYAIAHQDPMVAHGALRRSVASESQHPRILQLQNGALGDQVNAICEDPSLLMDLEGGTWQEFKSFVAEHRLAFSVERLIEGKHAASQKGIRHAPSHSPAYVSLLHRTPELKARLRESPEALQELAKKPNWSLRMQRR